MFDVVTKTLRSADGTELYAEARGDSSKPSVVFIHGFSMSTEVWREVFADSEWLKDVYIVAYDVRGHGRSGKPEDEESWTSKRLAEDFDTIVQAFGLDKPFVAAWSFGGVNVTDILSFHSPSYLSGIIFIAAFPYTTSLPSVASPFGLTLIPPLLSNDSVPNFQIYSTNFVDAILQPSFNPPYLIRLSLLGSLLTQPRGCAQRLLTRSQDEKGFLEAGKGGLPLLILEGEKDVLVLPDSCAKACNQVDGSDEQWKDMKSVSFEGGSHMFFMEFPDRFREEVLGFVRRVVGDRDSSMIREQEEEKKQSTCEIS
ncbi:Alpha/Beta hydrolase protein [Abortiporus biennis]|nr:Alpha/Beta hydrolase protein [Abortiporus biennis]